MKTMRLFVLALAAILLAGSASAQTADEIISNYIKAIGGKEKLSKLTSVYTEATIDAMGMQGTVKTTQLNGKGQRQDIDIAGAVITNCFNDKGGWSINPMAGSTTAESMPDAQYNQGKDQILIGAPMINYAEKGYKVELVGSDSVAHKAVFKLKLTSPTNNTSVYCFDKSTFFIVQSTTQSEMQGQTIENVLTFSDYRDTGGYFVPYKIDMDMAGGQFTMSMTVTKVELDKQVDETIFAKPS
jgi:hypothetical protein